MTFLVTHDTTARTRVSLFGFVTGAFAACMPMPEGAGLAAIVDLSRVKTNARLSQLLNVVVPHAAGVMGAFARGLPEGFPATETMVAPDGRTVVTLGPFGPGVPNREIVTFAWRPGFSSSDVAASMTRGGSPFGIREVAILIDDAGRPGWRQPTGADVLTLTAGVTSALSGVLA